MDFIPAGQRRTPTTNQIPKVLLLCRVYLPNYQFTNTKEKKQEWVESTSSIWNDMITDIYTTQNFRWAFKLVSNYVYTLPTERNKWMNEWSFLPYINTNRIIVVLCICICICICECEYECMTSKECVFRAPRTPVCLYAWCISLHLSYLPNSQVTCNAAKDWYILDPFE